jgi:hypothetical protein
VDVIKGVVITRCHVHAVLRNYLGIQTFGPRFDLKVSVGEMVDFLNPKQGATGEGVRACPVGSRAATPPEAPPVRAGPQNAWR